MDFMKIIEETAETMQNNILPADIYKVDHNNLESLVSIKSVHDMLPAFSTFFAYGFAFTTILILLTYGVTKAISLIHIKN